LNEGDLGGVEEPEVEPETKPAGKGERGGEGRGRK